MPPQEITGICNSVRPKRRYFIKDVFGGTPNTARETRALPTNPHHRRHFRPVKGISFTKQAWFCDPQQAAFNQKQP
jgi:hypothetical protein